MRDTLFIDFLPEFEATFACRYKKITYFILPNCLGTMDQFYDPEDSNRKRKKFYLTWSRYFVEFWFCEPFSNILKYLLQSEIPPISLFEYKQVGALSQEWASRCSESRWDLQAILHLREQLNQARSRPSNVAQTNERKMKKPSLNTYIRIDQKSCNIESLQTSDDLVDYL